MKQCAQLSREKTSLTSHISACVLNMVCERPPRLRRFGGFATFSYWRSHPSSGRRGVSSVAALILSVFALVFLGAPQSGSIYHGNWIDLNKNGRMDRYEDPSAPIESRIDNLLSQMNVEEKTAQMATLY